jgi:hypothetical protein
MGRLPFIRARLVGPKSGGNSCQVVCPLNGDGVGVPIVIHLHCTRLIGTSNNRTRKSKPEYIKVEVGLWFQRFLQTSWRGRHPGINREPIKQEGRDREPDAMSWAPWHLRVSGLGGHLIHGEPSSVNGVRGSH